MSSPALRHRQAKLARIAAVTAGVALTANAAPPMPEEGAVATEYQQLLARLHDDLRTLHNIQSKAAKAERKAEMIKAYLPWVEGALSIEDGQAAPQDEIVVTCYIWTLDIRDWELALRLVEHIVAHGLQLPERFHRTPGGMLISEMADVAIAEPGAVPHDILFRAAPGVGPAWDMKDETRARWFRALGESWTRAAEDFDPNAENATAGGKPALVDAALTALREATRLDPRVGVKKQIEQLEREEKKLAAAAATKQD